MARLTCEFPERQIPVINTDQVAATINEVQVCSPYWHTQAFRVMKSVSVSDTYIQCSSRLVEISTPLGHDCFFIISGAVCIQLPKGFRACMTVKTGDGSLMFWRSLSVLLSVFNVVLNSTLPTIQKSDVNLLCYKICNLINL